MRGGVVGGLLPWKVGGGTKPTTDQVLDPSTHMTDGWQSVHIDEFRVFERDICTCGHAGYV